MIPEIDSVIARIREVGDEYGKAKGSRVYLEHYRQSLIALLGAPIDGSQTAKEAHARAHKDYLTHLKALQAAVHEEERLKFELAALQNQFDAWRTNQANNRKEMGNYGA